MRRTTKMGIAASVVASALNTNAGAAPPADGVPTPGPGQLIFQTGFEAPARVEPSRGSDLRLAGADGTLSGAADPAAELRQRWGVEEFGLQFTGGEPHQRTAEIVPDPTRPDNRVLHFHINEPWPASENQIKARVQANAYNFKPGLKHFRQSVRLYLPEHTNTLRQFPKAISWLTIAEFWNKAYWVEPKSQGFRISLGIGKAEGEGDLHFILDAQGPSMKRVWHEPMSRVAVPVGKWMTLDYEFKEGDATTGRFVVAMTPDGEARQVVFDVTGYTRNVDNATSNGLYGWNPLKLYTSAGVVEFMKKNGHSLDAYWDDLKIWTDDRPTQSADGQERK